MSYLDELNPAQRAAVVFGVAADRPARPAPPLLDRAFPWCAEWAEPLMGLFARYVESKQAQAMLDYDDLLLYWSQMMQIGEIARLVSERFDHVLVDEYQDTNALQASILLGLKPDGAGLTVVGDDAQAIYSFRSATVRNILDFPGRFDPPAEVARLERNYRSTQPILEACNRIIAHAGESFIKTLFTTRIDGRRPLLAMVSDETAQVDFVIDRILANREPGMELHDQAVLFRTSHHASQLEVELVRRNIPFVKFDAIAAQYSGDLQASSSGSWFPSGLYEQTTFASSPTCGLADARRFDSPEASAPCG